MSVRLVLAVADAARRNQRRREKGGPEEPPSAQQARHEAEAGLKDLLPPDVSEALPRAADWQRMAQRLTALKQAGVDIDRLLPPMGEAALTVRDRVPANEAGVALEGAAEWERTLRETLPAGPVREALLSSPDWPEISAAMAESERHGVDVRQILAAAHAAGLGIGESSTASRDALLAYGPLTDGLDIAKDLDLSDRARALRQLSISPQENARYVRLVKDALPGREREADLAVTAKQWPLVAARMAEMERQRKPLAAHLAGLAEDSSWERGPSGQVGSRLVWAVSHHLRHPAGAAPPALRPTVSASAARSQSSAAGPVRARTAGESVPAQPGVAVHRQRGGPVAGWRRGPSESGRRGGQGRVAPK